MGRTASMVFGLAVVLGAVLLLALALTMTAEPALAQTTSADLSLTKTATPIDGRTKALHGEVLQYDLTVRNDGPDTAADVVVTDTLPAGVEIIQASICGIESNTLTCALRNHVDFFPSGYLSSGQEVTITIYVRMTTVGTITNTATVSSDTADPDTADNTATVQTEVQPAADLSLSSEGAYGSGDGNTTLPHVVHNSGPDAAANVVFYTVISGEFVSATPSQGTCSADTTYSDYIECSLGEVPSGASVRVDVVEKRPTDGGTYTNFAEVVSDTGDPYWPNGHVEYYYVAPDLTPPETVLDPTGPTGTVNADSATFSFSSSYEPYGVAFECRVYPTGTTPVEDFGGCSGTRTHTVSSLSDGSHTFEVRAKDAPGNVDATPASRTWTVDTTGPSGTISINGRAAYTKSATVTLAPSASDPAPNSGVAGMRFSNDGVTWSAWQDFATTRSWTLTSTNGTKTVRAQYKDGAGNVSATVSDTIILDTIKPKVTGATPTGTGVKRNTNLTATFSEKMNRTTLSKTTFKLYKINPDGTTMPITNVTVALSSDGLKATINPFGGSSILLKANTRYKVVVTTGAKDLAGNALDQSPTVSGSQQKVWYFKTGTS